MVIEVVKYASQYNYWGERMYEKMMLLLTIVLVIIEIIDLLLQVR
jgi:hypothetical protein